MSLHSPNENITTTTISGGGVAGGSVSDIERKRARQWVHPLPSHTFEQHMERLGFNEYELVLTLSYDPDGPSKLRIYNNDTVISTFNGNTKSDGVALTFRNEGPNQQCVAKIECCIYGKHPLSIHHLEYKCIEQATVQIEYKEDLMQNPVLVWDIAVIY